MSFLRILAVYTLKGYQRWISPFLSPSCRFYPSCSGFALQAFTQLSLGKALLAVSRRLFSCHPWGRVENI